MNPDSTRPYVLLIEDDPNDELFFKRTWQKLDYMGDLTVLRTGGELVECFRALSSGGKAAPCLIILDSGIHPFSPEDICRAIQTLPTHIPIVLLSGGKDSPLEHSLCGARLFSVIQKPISFEGLRSCMLTHCFPRLTD